MVLAYRHAVPHLLELYDLCKSATQEPTLTSQLTHIGLAIFVTMDVSDVFLAVSLAMAM
jgi:hypothetical protein